MISFHMCIVVMVLSRRWSRFWWRRQPRLYDLLASRCSTGLVRCNRRSRLLLPSTTRRSRVLRAVQRAVQRADQRSIRRTSRDRRQRSPWDRRQRSIRRQRRPIRVLWVWWIDEWSSWHHRWGQESNSNCFCEQNATSSKTSMVVSRWYCACVM